MCVCSCLFFSPSISFRPFLVFSFLVSYFAVFRSLDWSLVLSRGKSPRVTADGSFVFLRNTTDDEVNEEVRSTFNG